MTETPATLSQDLIDAIKEKNVEKVRAELAKSGFNPNAKDKDGWTPLFYAAWYGTDEIVNMLIKAGADVNVQDKIGCTPLDYAARYGTPEMVRDLLEKGADINVENKHGWTALHWATANNPNVLKVLLEKLEKDGMTDKINAQDRYGWTPLHVAARDGTPEVVQALVENGANINAQDENGCTPLHIAVQNGTLEQVKALLEAGADKSIKNKEGKTPRDLIEERLKNEKVPNKKPELGQIKKALDAKKAEPNDGKQGEQGKTEPEKTTTLSQDLIDAIKEKNVEKVRAKIAESGFDPNAKSEYGFTPLFYAVWHGTDEMVQALIDAGADVNAQGAFGSTLLHHAVCHGTPKMVNALLKKGANVNVQDEQGWTPLHDAVFHGTPEMVKALLDAGADKSIENKEKKTALQVLDEELKKPGLTDKDKKRLGRNKAALSGETDAEATVEPKGDKDGKPKDDKDGKGAKAEDGKGDKDGKTDAEATVEPKDDKPKDGKGDKDDKPKGNPKPKRTGGAKPSGGKPGTEETGEPGPTTTERPPEAQGLTAGGTTPGGAPATQPAQEESGGIGHWLRNSWFGSFFGLDDESVAKRAQSAQVLASYGEEGGGWFRNSMLGRWFGLDDESRIKKLQAANPTPVATSGTTTMYASYGAGREVPTHTVARPANAAGCLRGSSEDDLTIERDGKTPGRQISGRGRGM